MLEALDKSVEERSMISEAKRYLNGILSSMAQNERRKTISAQVMSHQSVTSPLVGESQVIDLTL
jgi:chromodomain-helicase-DNA-binding protein 4